MKTFYKHYRTKMMDSIMKPTVVSVNNINYYNTKDLKSYDPMYFRGCSRSIRKIIDKKDINSDDYLYAQWNRKTKWNAASNQSKPSTKAQLLLKESWVLENYPKLMDNPPEDVESLPQLPDILNLSDEEKFHDDNNNIVEIETRGERTTTGIYFSAKDVSIGFNMPSLNKTIMQPDKGYVIDEHYKTFEDTTVSGGYSLPNRKRLYITYTGMLKILFNSRTGNASKFVKWATETLFTAQMGSSEQKEDLASGLIGMPVKSFRAVLKKSASSLPCVYRFALGYAKDLRGEMNLPETIPDNYVIIKYGLSDDLDRRTSEHSREYGRISGVKLELMNFAYIDPKYLSQAEHDIRGFFETIEHKINYKNYTELIAINPEHEKTIQNQFKYINKEYAGCVKELIIQLEKKNMEIDYMKEKHQWELQDKDRIIEIKDKNISVERLEKEKALLQLELEKMKSQK